MQTSLIFLETRITTIGSDKHVGVHKDVVGVNSFRWLRHRLECQMWKLFTLLLCEQIKMPYHPYAKLKVNDFLVFKPSLSKE